MEVVQHIYTGQPVVSNHEIATPLQDVAQQTRELTQALTHGLAREPVSALRPESNVFLPILPWKS